MVGATIATDIDRFKALAARLDIKPE